MRQETQEGCDLFVSTGCFWLSAGYGWGTRCGGWTGPGSHEGPVETVRKGGAWVYSAAGHGVSGKGGRLPLAQLGRQAGGSQQFGPGVALAKRNNNGNGEGFLSFSTGPATSPSTLSPASKALDPHPLGFAFQTLLPISPLSPRAHPKLSDSTPGTPNEP